MSLRDKLDAWITAREHPQGSTQGVNPLHVPELEALLAAIVALLGCVVGEEPAADGHYRGCFARSSDGPCSCSRRAGA